MRELRNHTKDVLDAVERGEEVVITRSGEPVARITPINQSATVAAWLDELEAAPVVETGWLDQLLVERRADDEADRLRESQ